MKVINQETQIEKEKLLKILAVSVGLDLLTTSGALATWGLGIIVEELIENVVSQMIAKYGKIELSAFDNAVGLLPIPGVTAVSVHCARKLLAMYFSK